MPHVNPTLPNDGETADAGDVSIPFAALLAIFNGHIGPDNIEPGSMNWGIMDEFTDQIPSAAMEDDGNLVKMRDELGAGFVPTGLIWSVLTGLNATMTEGVVYAPNGARATVNAVATHAFTASKDTYVDVSPTGSISYTEVTNGAASPALTSNYTRLAKVVTNGSTVTSISVGGVDSLGNQLRPSTFQRTYATGTIDITSTGTKTVSGLPFSPRMIKLTAILQTSDVSSAISTSYYDGANMKTFATASRADDNSSRYYTDRMAFVSIDSGGTLVVTARYDGTSITADGFTLNCSTAASVILFYEAFA